MANLVAALQALAALPQVENNPKLNPITPQIETPEFIQFPALEPPPAAPSAAIDRRIIDQYLALLPPAPVAPVAPAPQPVGTLDKIAAALSGIGAGIQGQGPQFVTSLREQRERPQREFEAKQERYDQQKFQVGLRGLEAAQTAEEKRQARATAEADRRFELDVKDRARQLGFKDSVAIEKLRDAMQTERLKEQERIADEKQKAAFDQQMKIQKGKLRKDFLDQGAGKFADELASYALGQIETLSPGAEKANRTIQLKIQDLQRRAAGGGGGGGASTGAIMAVLENGQFVPQSLVNKETGAVMMGGKPVNVVGYVGGGIPNQGGGGGAANVEQELRGFIQREQTAKTPPAEIARKVRSAPGYATSKDLAEKLIQELGLSAPAKPLFGWTDPKTGVTTPMFTTKPFTAPGAKVREGGAAIRGK